MGAVKIEKRHAHIISARRKKSGRKLMIAYVLQGVIFFALALMIVLMVCGVLYIKEHLAHTPDSELSAGGTDIFTNDDTLSGTPIMPIAPTIPGNARVALDAGHGGIEPGCEFMGVLEKDITLSVTLALKEKLKEYGVDVVLTREGDQDVSLDERCAIANTASADLFVSIHCNSYIDDTSIKGFEGYYYQDANGKRLADLILSATENYPSIKTRSVKEENYKVLRDTEMPAVLLEIGYLSNKAERTDLQSSEYQDTLAQVIFEGIIATLP